MRQPDTRSLVGYCSLRRWDGRRQAGRWTAVNPRRIWF